MQGINGINGAAIEGIEGPQGAMCQPRRGERADRALERSWGGQGDERESFLGVIGNPKGACRRARARRKVCSEAMGE